MYLSGKRLALAGSEQNLSGVFSWLGNLFRGNAGSVTKNVTGAVVATGMKSSIPSVAASSVSKAALTASAAALPALSVAKTVTGQVVATGAKLSPLAQASASKVLNPNVVASGIKGTAQASEIPVIHSSKVVSPEIARVATEAPQVSPAVPGAAPQIVQAQTGAPVTDVIRGLLPAVPIVAELAAMRGTNGGAVTTGYGYTDAAGNFVETGAMPQGGDLFAPGQTLGVDVPQWLLPVGIGAALLLLLPRGSE